MNKYLENQDLTAIHAVLCLIGILLSVWYHQWLGQGKIPGPARLKSCTTQRLSLVLMALSMCWSLSYAHVQHWQPWPSYVLTLLAIDLFLFATLTAVIRGTPTQRPMPQ